MERTATGLKTEEKQQKKKLKDKQQALETVRTGAACSYVKLGMQTAVRNRQTRLQLIKIAKIGEVGRRGENARAPAEGKGCRASTDDRMGELDLRQETQQ